MATRGLITATAALIAVLLLAAHFWRAQWWLGVAWCVAALPLILVSDRVWAVRALQATLVLATLEWLRTALVLAQQRQAFGAPWGRMAVILLAVALFSALTAWALRPRR